MGVIWEANMIKTKKQGLLIVISAPSGAGKGTIINELLGKAREVDRLPTSSKQFYATMRSLYERFINHDYLKAIDNVMKSK